MFECSGLIHINPCDIYYSCMYVLSPMKWIRIVCKLTSICGLRVSRYELSVASWAARGALFTTTCGRHLP